MKLKYIEHADGRIQKVHNHSLPGPARMQRAKGPGSMDCENEIMALAGEGKVKEALDLYDRHCATRGVQPSVRVWQWSIFARVA